MGCGARLDTRLRQRLFALTSRGAEKETIELLVKEIGKGSIVRGPSCSGRGKHMALGLAWQTDFSLCAGPAFFFRTKRSWN